MANAITETVWFPSVALAAFLCCTTALAETDSAVRPPPIYIDRGACPFECCIYRRWTVNHPTPLLNRPDGKKALGSLGVGEIVEGITGEVRSAPIPVKADRDMSGTPIKAGDTYYVLHYNGEGLWKVWIRGRLALVGQGVRVPDPKADWWVKVKDARGNVGRALSTGNFDHQDRCE